MEKQHCLNCAHFHPTDKSQEIGVCFNAAVPIVLRYRFRFETWSGWEANACGVHAPLFSVTRRQANALDKQLEREQATRVSLAYWKVVKEERKARLDQMVGV